jgi:hypothetical protein
MFTKKETRTTSKTVNENQSKKGQSNVSADHLRKLIAESAYYRAQQRGFKGGNPVEDWLAAEREVNAQTKTNHTN